LLIALGMGVAFGTLGGVLMRFPMFGLLLLC